MIDAREFKPGKLVRLRRREWIVQPTEDRDVLRIKPLGGAEEETTGIYLPFAFENERIDEYFFPLPEREDFGDLASARLLYDAVRLGFRDASGPFRSIAKFNFQPRAYQMVPLIMALRQEGTVRLFIADDVGIGKTIESLMVAREMLDRGLIKRVAIVCLPHLCEQWQQEMRDKFGLEAVIVRSSTAATLDRKTPGDISAFAHYPFQVVSIDYVKTAKRIDSFVADCPGLVIVDEVHTASASPGAGRQQRHHLLRQLSEKPNQNLLLLSATPHSGKPEEFQSLLGLLDPGFACIEIGKATDAERRRLAAQYVQRRRKDIERWVGAKLKETTPFPEREPIEVAYPMSPEYLQLQYDVMRLAQKLATKDESKTQRKRLNYWTALGLLRGVMSSPAAGITMLNNRARKVAEDDDGDDYASGGFASGGGPSGGRASGGRDVGREGSGGDDSDDGSEFDALTVLAEADDNPVIENDFDWGRDLEPELYETETGESTTLRKHRHELSSQLQHIHKEGLDLKVKALVTLVKQWHKDGFSPIVYCRYIRTAEYVGQVLAKAFPKKVGIATVTSKVPDEERQAAVDKLGDSELRVLVATDCMSEGINLQRYFTAIIHYDLPWNPNRLEQREGRVDRFGQTAPVVRTALLYGEDNPMDGIVLKVLLRKAREIKKAIGVSVPFPENNQSIMDAVTQAVLLKAPPSPGGMQLGMFDNMPEVNQKATEVEIAYKRIEEVEVATRSIFAQYAVKAQDIDQDLADAIRLIGDMDSVEQFVLRAVTHLGGNYKARNGGYRIEKEGLPAGVDHLFGDDNYLDVSFATPTPEGFRYVARNHPLVDSLSQVLMSEAMAGADGEVPLSQNRVRRTAVVRTAAVTRTTTLLLLRVRNVIQRTDMSRQQLVAEELMLKGYRGTPPDLEWLPEAEALALLQSEASAEVAAVEKREAIDDALSDYAALKEVLDGFGREQAERLVEAHDRFRVAVKGPRRYQVVEPILPMDLMGVYVFIPDLTQ